MPLYEYACQSCGHQFEVRQKISDDPIRTCPNCKKDTVERLVSMTSFTLKGSGWYADGYGAGGKSGRGTESSTSDAPKTEAAKTDVAKSEAPKADAPKTEAPKSEAKPKKDSGD